MPVKKVYTDAKLKKALEKQHKWKVRILVAGWPTLKQFCADIGVEWDWFRDYKTLVFSPEKTKLVEKAIRTGP